MTPTCSAAAIYPVIIRVRMATFLEEDLALLGLDDTDADLASDDADDVIDPDELEEAGDLDIPVDAEEE